MFPKIKVIDKADQKDLAFPQKGFKGGGKVSGQIDKAGQMGSFPHN